MPRQAIRNQCQQKGHIIRKNNTNGFGASDPNCLQYKLRLR